MYAYLASDKIFKSNQLIHDTNNPYKKIYLQHRDAPSGEQGGGQLPPQILADQKAPPGSGGAPQRAALLPAPPDF